MKKHLLGLVSAVVVLIVAGVILLISSHLVLVKTNNGLVSLTVERAGTEAERNQGLMFRERLPAQHGMLFLFDAPQKVNFWMKHTKIPLALIFFAPDGRVSEIVKEAVPCPEGTANCPLYPSHDEIGAVLEVNSSELIGLSIQPGDQAYWIPNLW